jgi:triosephosphate isomerase (TIM)
MTANRVPLLAGNWKMFGTATEAADLVGNLLNQIGDLRDRDVLIAPPFTALEPVARQIAGSRILLAGQNLHWEPHGAFTGEISAPMLRSVGCTHAIIGHSERRQLFGETDESVARKLASALHAGLTPILCVGETLSEREGGITMSVVKRQIASALGHIPADAIAGTIVAYEPVWAIGTGRVATPEQAQEVHHALRAQVAGLADPGVAARVRILYGGSVKPDNIDALMTQPDLDGALVGGASLKAADFARIVRFTS